VVTDTGLVSVDLLEQQTLPVIKASINGLLPEYFILDTGAPTSVLSRAYCDRHNIPYLGACPSIETDCAGNEIEAYPALVHRIDIAGVVVRNWTCNVMSLSPKLQVGGILSPLDTLRGIPSELDMRDRKFRVHLGMSVPTWSAKIGEPVQSAPLVWDDGNVFVRAIVNCQAEGWFLLDSGAAGNSVTPEFARNLGINPPPENQFQSVTAGGTTLVSRGFAGDLAIAGSSPVKSEFFISEGPVAPDLFAPLIPSGDVGVPWMTNRKLLFAPSGQLILFTESKQAPAL
jgi:hypothetical protein